MKVVQKTTGTLALYVCIQMEKIALAAKNDTFANIEMKMAHFEQCELYGKGVRKNGI